MNKSVLGIVTGFSLFALSCQSHSGKGKNNMDNVTTDTVGEYNFTDTHSQSNAKEIHPTHLSLNISVNFDKQQISGSAAWAIDPNKGVKYAVFDTKQMEIDSVLYEDGSRAAFELGKEDSLLGQSLKITLKPETKKLVIYYKTGKNATALQWLQPSQTFGKKYPFLYTQSEAIHARSWVPCADGPGYRFTYDATVKVPKGLLALMSAENPQKINDSGVYHFEMKESIPSYLLAMAVGKIGFKAIDNRTGVYAEPAILEKSYNELDGIGTMLDTAISLVGKYRWVRYDVLILPSGFPMGGMENPRLTFATPTILAGDKSLVNLIAHEMAHSWSGDLVTNATWNDVWLNEGITTYIERRISEALHGKEHAAMLWDLSKMTLEKNVQQLGKDSKDTWLKGDFDHRDPDDAFSDIPYEKGSAFMLLVERTVGRKNFDAFLKKYFNQHAFQPMTTERFLKYMDGNLLNEHDDWKRAIDIKAWVYGPGIPSNYPKLDYTRFKKVDAQVTDFLKGTPSKSLNTNGWGTYEWLRFLHQLPENLSITQMKELDNTFKFTKTGNSEIADVWFLHALESQYKPAYPAMKQFLYVTGREKFLEPLYRQMMQSDWGKKMAGEIYQIARPNYHPLAQEDIDTIVNK